MRENIIVMVGGRSGVGKTSIIDFLVKNQGERYARPLSYTSRLKRNGEGCEEYNFISEEKMILMRDEGRFLNFDCVYGNYYAIAKKSIDVINTEGKVPIKEIHPSNQAKIKLCYPNAVSVLIKEIGVNGEEKRIGREKADTEYYENLNPTSQKEEQVVPVEEESRTDNSDVPVYYESFSYAAENGEVDLYRISRQLNEECRNAIEEAIADNFDGMHLADDATKSVVEQFGMERMGYILAYTLNYNNHDGRYSHSNKEWADTTCKGERGSNIRTDWIVRSHPAVLNGFVDMYRKELAADQQREPEKPFVQQFYVVTDLQTNPMQIEKFGNLDDAMSCYQQVPNFHLKALGVEKTPDPLPGSLDIVQCKNGIDTIVEDYKKVPGWDNPYIQNHVVTLVAEALKVQDVAVAYEINDGYFYIQTSEDGCDYTLYNKDFTVMDGGIVETDEYRPVQEVMEVVLAEHGHSVSECGVISAEYLQEQSYRVETQRAEAMKEKLAAEKPTPEASISFYVAECAEFPVMGEFHDNLTLEQALEVYDKIPAERMNGIKSIGFSLEDGSIYSGMFDLMVGGEVQAEVVNHIQHYRESPLVQKAISDMKTLLEKQQASKELEERPNTRQSVREALKNRKKAQEQQSNQEQAKPKKAKKKGEMKL